MTEGANPIKTGMSVAISPTSPTPIYAQIAQQIAAQIVRGDLTPGEALPPIRTVARQLEISVITVKKAWEVLERDGFIYGIVGKGSFVAPHHADSLPDKRKEMALDHLRRDLPFYRDLGLTADELCSLVRTVYGE